MASVWGALGQLSPAATTLTDAYTVPASKHGAVQIVICNNSAGAVTVRVSHAINGAANAAAQYLLYDYSIAVGGSASTAKIAVRAGDKIRVYASATDVAFNINGVEDDD